MDVGLPPTPHYPHTPSPPGTFVVCHATPVGPLPAGPHPFTVASWGGQLVPTHILVLLVHVVKNVTSWTGLLVLVPLPHLVIFFFPIVQRSSPPGTWTVVP